MEQDIESLYHAVEVTNNAEKSYIMEWLEAQGIDSSKLEGLFKFPMLVYTSDGTWMTEYEKVETTVSFREFINGLEVELPKVLFKVQGRAGGAIGKLLGGFIVTSELPYKVFMALNLDYVTFEKSAVKLYANSEKTEDELILIKECLQELTEFGFGDFTMEEGTP